MSGISLTSDVGIVDLLRQSGSMGVSELAQATDVTPTAVRQRLSRLMSQGLVGRETFRSGRGRPSHRYVLTEKGRLGAGNNFADLATALWGEIRSITEPSVRRGLIARMAGRMAGMYADQVEGESLSQRMQSVADVFGQRKVPLTIETIQVPPKQAAPGELTQEPTPPSEAAVLTVLACPYPALAEVDRSVCAMERMMFAQLLEQDVRLTACRLDGDACCRFQTVPLAVSIPATSG